MFAATPREKSEWVSHICSIIGKPAATEGAVTAKSNSGKFAAYASPLLSLLPMRPLLPLLILLPMPLFPPLLPPLLLTGVDCFCHGICNCLCRRRRRRCVGRLFARLYSVSICSVETPSRPCTCVGARHARQPVYALPSEAVFRREPSGKWRFLGRVAFFPYKRVFRTVPHGATRSLAVLLPALTHYTPLVHPLPPPALVPPASLQAVWDGCVQVVLVEAVLAARPVQQAGPRL